MSCWETSGPGIEMPLYRPTQTLLPRRGSDSALTRRGMDKNTPGVSCGVWQQGVCGNSLTPVGWKVSALAHPTDARDLGSLEARVTRWPLCHISQCHSWAAFALCCGRAYGFPAEHCILTRWSLFLTSPVSPFTGVADRCMRWRFYLCWWVRQTLWWTWCRTDPASWWPGSRFLCLPKCPSVPPLPSPSPCTPSRCALLKNKGRRIAMMSHFPPISDSSFSYSLLLRWSWNFILPRVCLYVLPRVRTSDNGERNDGWPYRELWTPSLVGVEAFK